MRWNTVGIPGRGACALAASISLIKRGEGFELTHSNEES